MESAGWKYTVESIVYGIWYIKGIWKLQYELDDSRINWFT